MIEEKKKEITEFNVVKYEKKKNVKLDVKNVEKDLEKIWFFFFFLFSI